MSLSRFWVCRDFEFFGILSVRDFEFSRLWVVGITCFRDYVTIPRNSTPLLYSCWMFFHFQIGKCENKQREFSRSPKSFSRTSFPFARRSFILVIRQFYLNSEKEWFVFVENQKKIQKVFLWKFKKKKSFKRKQNSIKWVKIF